MVLGATSSAMQREALVLPPVHVPSCPAPLAAATEEHAAIAASALATSIIVSLDLTQRLGGLTDKDQLPVQPKRSSLILVRKPALTNTAPRVPSTLRMVVGGAAAVCPGDSVCDDSDDDTSDSVTAATNLPAIAATSANSSTTPAMPLTTINTLQPVPLASQVSSPMLRRDGYGPTLMNLIDRPVDKSKCLPYPHTMDCYTPRPRPHSLNTLSSVSCRLYIVTLDQEYQEYSYKKKAHVAVRPSAVRGWVKLFRGKVKYSVGQVIASPSLILQGNRDISRGTAQMNLSRHQQQRKRSEIQSSRASTSSKLSRKSMLSTSEPASSSGSSSTTASRLRNCWRQPRDDKPIPDSNLLAKGSSLFERPLSVIEMAVAAEAAAEMELAEISTSLLTTHAPSTQPHSPCKKDSSNLEMVNTSCDASVLNAIP